MWCVLACVCRSRLAVHLRLHQRRQVRRHLQSERRRHQRLPMDGRSVCCVLCYCVLGVRLCLASNRLFASALCCLSRPAGIGPIPMNELYLYVDAATNSKPVFQYRDLEPFGTYEGGCSPPASLDFLPLLPLLHVSMYSRDRWHVMFCVVLCCAVLCCDVGGDLLDCCTHAQATSTPRSCRSTPPLRPLRCLTFPAFSTARRATAISAPTLWRSAPGTSSSSWRAPEPKPSSIK
jgi:hypothetical protein